MLYNKDIKKERTTTMARHYRFLGRKSRPYTSVGALMVTASTKKSSRPGWLFSCSKTAKRCGRYVTYILMQKHQSQFAPLFQLFVKPDWLPWYHTAEYSMVDNYVHICSGTKRDRCGMYPKKTLSAASLLSECERKRCRSLEARGCAKSESEFSMGTAATCPF